jgi:hypothetical protein
VRLLFLSLLLLLVTCGACTGSKGHTDTYVAGGSDVAAWAVTADGRVKVPLANGVAWAQPTVAKDASESTLLKVRGNVGPTFVVVARIDDAPKPLTLATCAVAHAERIAKAVSSANVFTSPPTVSEERRRGETVPRVHYVVPLEAAAGVRGAATITWWTYFLDQNRCIGVGVTAVVREKVDDASNPDPEDMQRLERVFALVLEGTQVTE